MTFEWILSSCFLILVIMLLRKALGGKISARLRYALWLVVLLRLLVPVQLFPMDFGKQLVEKSIYLVEKSIYVFPSGSFPVEEAQENGVYIREDGQPQYTGSMGYVRLEDGGETIVRYLDKLSPLEAAEIAWKGGAVVFALLFLGCNLRFGRRLRRMRKLLEDGESPLPVYRAEGLPSPCLFGLLRPAIYLTGEAAEDGEMRRHVLLHELSHFRHGDHIWSALRCAALSIHWWNPLVWLAVILSRRDGELACDESAIKRLDGNQRAAYGETLLRLVTAKPKPGDLFSCATTMTGGKRSLRERIERIACERKILVRAAITTILLASAATACSFGQAKPQEAEPADFQSAPVTSQLPEPEAPGQTESRQSVGGSYAEEAYMAITGERPFQAVVEMPDGARTAYQITEQNDSNVEHVGLYLSVSFDWYEAEAGEWEALTREEQGLILTIVDREGNEFQCASGSGLARISLDGEDRWFYVVDNDPFPGTDGGLFQFVRMVADNAAGAAVWSVTADGSITDYDTAARALTEAVARGYREAPAWVEWKPTDVRVQEGKDLVYDAYSGEPENFVCDMPFLVGVEDPMSASAGYWQAGAGLEEAVEYEEQTYYTWGRTALVKRNADGDWYIADRGTGGYTALLPFDLDTAPVEELVDAWFKTVGYSHEYLIFQYLCDRGAGQLGQLNDVFAQRSGAEDFFTGLYRYLKDYGEYHTLTLEEAASLLEEPYRGYFEE